jgi:hypothetical protein
MIEKHPGAAPLLAEWETILDRSVPEIAEVLLDLGSKARELRQVTPFAGILSPPDRGEVYRRFAEGEGSSP